MPEALRIFAFKTFVNRISAAESILSLPIGQKSCKESHTSLTFPLHSLLKEVLRTCAGTDNTIFALIYLGQRGGEWSLTSLYATCPIPQQLMQSRNKPYFTCLLTVSGNTFLFIIKLYYWHISGHRIIAP